MTSLDKLRRHHASPFSWRRTVATSGTTALHAAAFLFIAAPMTPPMVQARPVVPNLAVQVLPSPPPRVLQPVPAMPEPPPPPPPVEVVRVPVVRSAPPAVPVSSEPSRQVVPVVAVAPDRQPSATVATVAPSVNLSVRQQNPPRYPAQAIRRHQQGTVVLMVRVSAEGLPIEVRVDRSSGYAALDRAAVQAVRAWRFNPDRQAGQPVAGWARVPIRFNLGERF